MNISSDPVTSRGVSSESVFDRDRRIRNSKLTMAQTFYLVTLNQYIGNNEDAWPSQETIANAMNACDRAVRKWQTQLEEIGVLQVDVWKGRSLTNRYRLNLDALPLKPERSSSFSDLINKEPRSAFTDSEQTNTEPGSGVMRNQVPVNTEPSSYRKKKKDQLKKHSLEDVLKIWNEAFDSNSIPTDKRRAMLRSRLKEPFFVANWQTAIDRARSSPFCCGHNDRGWVANIDWFLKPDTVVKLMEGNHDGEITTTASKAELREQQNADAIATVLRLNEGIDDHSRHCLVNGNEIDTQAYIDPPAATAKPKAIGQRTLATAKMELRESIECLRKREIRESANPDPPKEGSSLSPEARAMLLKAMESASRQESR